MSIIDDIGDGLSDIGDSISGVVEKGVHIVEDVFGGPGNIVGVIASAGAAAIVGPGYVIPVFVGSSVATNALIRHREMRGSEYEYARQVYGDSLPPADRIVLTNLSGLGGRKFVVPSRTSFGQYVVNLGDAYDNPLNFMDGGYPQPGQVLIHELAHVWQIKHCSFVPAFTCGVLVLQYRGSILGRDVYNQGPIRNGSFLGRDWSSYNFEEQATLVDSWYAKQGYALRRPEGPLQDAVEQALRSYINLNVRPGAPNRAYKFLNPAEVVAALTVGPWRVRYSDGTARKVQFFANGTCKFERITATPASPPASRLKGAVVERPSGLSSIIRAPSALAGMVVSRPSGLREALAPARPIGVEPPITAGMLKDYTTSGRWTCRPGMVTVEWTFDSEQWPTPLTPIVRGTRLTPGGSFTAEYFGSGKTGGGVVVK